MEQRRSVAFELRTLSNLVKRELRHATGLNGEAGLPPMHGPAVGYFYFHQDEDIFQRDFEKEFEIRRSTATKILQLMEKNGYITRVPVETDGRLKKICLTKKAITLYENLLPKLQEVDIKLESGLTPREREQFFIISDKIKTNLASHPDTAGESKHKKENQKQ